MSRLNKQDLELLQTGKDVDLSDPVISSILYITQKDKIQATSTKL